MTKQTGASPEQDRPSPPGRLPQLRDDLVLMDGGVDAVGDPTWRIYDPLRHRYISIDRITRNALELWPLCPSLEMLAKSLSQRMGRTVDRDDLTALESFLRQNDLVVAEHGQWRRRVDHEEANRKSWGHRLLHGYLFFRIPLFAPDALLRRVVPHCAFVFRPAFFALLAGLALLGLYLVSRQWDAFLSEGRVLFTAAGLALFGATLLVVKVAHELGHAIVAARMGCRVPVMGIAVMMGAPMLYTDVTDAWRLKDKRDRIAIDAAGVAVELILAVFATLLWVLLPDGIARTAAFLIASASWFMSLAINLNPFIKFDGYYILSDLLGIENLQTRAMDLGTWAMRRMLLGLETPSPEPTMQRGMQRLVTLYAFGTWAYRLILFTGIALLVYHTFFKLLGLALFIVEIGYFIVRPIAHEAKAWWSMRAEIARSRRARISAALLASGVVLMIVPWSSQVSAPAFVEARDLAHVYARKPGKLLAVAVQEGQMVKAGDVLARLSAPDLEHEQRVTAARLQAVGIRIARIASSDQDRLEWPLLQQAERALKERLAGIEREMRDLELRAPIDGVIREWDKTLRPGQWITARHQLGLVVNSSALTIVGYIREQDTARIVTGALATFIPDAGGAHRMHAQLTRIATANAAQITAAELTVTNGGLIDVAPDQKANAHQPLTTLYRVELATPPTMEATDAVLPFRQRGVILVAATPESLLLAAVRRILQVIIRESAA